jgi:hypothetical protein
LWFSKQEIKDVTQYSKLLSEIKSEYSFKINNIDFSINCKSDRIELTKESYINFADYKTGSFPSEADVSKLKSPQLLLTSYIYSKNPDYKNFKFGDLIYYNLSTSDNGPSKIIYNYGNHKILNDLEQELNNLLLDVFNTNKPFLSNPRLDIEDIYDDYKHLARIED